MKIRFRPCNFRIQRQSSAGEWTFFEGDQSTLTRRRSSQKLNNLVPPYRRWFIDDGMIRRLQRKEQRAPILMTGRCAVLEQYIHITPQKKEAIDSYKSPLRYQKFSPKIFYLPFGHMHEILNIVKK